MYELIILSFLMRAPYHGYLMAKIINDIIGPFARVSNGRLYPLLAKLEADGLIAEVDADQAGPEGCIEHRGDRHQRTYKITEPGRLRFHQLMLDTTSNPGEYRNLFWHKVPSLCLLEPTERLHLLDHYLAYCQTHIFHGRAERDDLTQNGLQKYGMDSVRLNAILSAANHFLRSWELELEDARRLREHALATAPHPSHRHSRSETE